MVFLAVSIVGGIIGGAFVSQFMSEYSLGTVGNVVTGFLGGTVAHSVMMYSLGGNEYSVAVVSGFFFGVIARAGFSVIRNRMFK